MYKNLSTPINPLYIGLNNLPIILIEIDNTGKTTHLSGKGLITAGINPKKSLGYSIIDLFGRRKQVYKAFVQALLGKSFHGELSGSKHSFEVWISPQKNTDFIVTGAVCMAIDITKRKKAQQALIKSKKTAELAQTTEKKFVANISHQIRTPLNAIIGLTELLIDTPLNKTQSKYLHSIHQASNDLLAIVNDVLHFAKINAGTVQLTNKFFTLTNLFTEIKETLQPRIQETNTALHFYIDNNIPNSLQGDKLRIKQILLNLINNALKFTPSHKPSYKKTLSDLGKNSSFLKKEFFGQVNVKAVFQKQNSKSIEIALIVSDNGIGIPKSQLKNIFKSFTQLNKQLDKFKGAGLGLAITRKLVDALGGSIMVTSKINQGSTFTCLLPLQTSHHYPFRKTKSHKRYFLQHKSLTNYHILLIEDNPLNQLVAQDMLSNQEADVTIVDRGSKALNLLKRQSFDIILTDINLAGRFGGIQTIRKIRTLLKNNASIPIIVVSAYHETSHRQICLNAGANDYLIKPYTQSQLIAIIKKNFIQQKKSLSSSKNFIPKANKLTLSHNLHQKLMITFLKQTPNYLQTLTIATKHADWQKIHHIMHQISPSLQYLQLHDLYKKMVTIKNLQKKSSLQKISPLQKKTLFNFINDCFKVLEEMKKDTALSQKFL